MFTYESLRLTSTVVDGVTISLYVIVGADGTHASGYEIVLENSRTGSRFTICEDGEAEALSAFITSVAKTQQHAAKRKKQTTAMEREHDGAIN